MALLSNLQGKKYKKEALNLLLNVMPTKLVDFEGIAKYHNVNIMLYVPKKDG